MFKNLKIGEGKVGIFKRQMQQAKGLIKGKNTVPSIL